LALIGRRAGAHLRRQVRPVALETLQGAAGETLAEIAKSYAVDLSMIFELTTGLEKQEKIRCHGGELLPARRVTHHAAVIGTGRQSSPPVGGPPSPG
jgi:hypothetical protein